MMPDLDLHTQQKEKILLTMKVKGPCLPVQISKVLNVSPLFAAAFLSELKSEDKVKISDMKVGSSPLYYLPGQEQMLENFVKFLNQREREAYSALREKLVLEDEKQEPVIRVALRALKDFAVPFRLFIDGNEKVFWKYFALNDEDLQERISVFSKKTNSGKTKKEVEKSSGESIPEKKIMGHIEDVKHENSSNVPEKKSKIVEGAFGKEVNDFLNRKNIEVVEKFFEKKKEFEARVKVDGFLGKQEFYLIAKDKKSATDNDLVVAWQKAQSTKLPAFLITTGDLNKKAREYLKEWGNLVRWDKLS